MPFVAVVVGTAVEIDAAVDSVVVVAVVEGVVDTAAVAVVDTEPVAVHFEYTVGFVVVVADTAAAVIELVCTAAAVVAVVSIAAEIVAVVPVCKVEAEAVVDTAAAAASKTAVVQALLGTASADQNLGLEAFEMESVLDSGGVAIRQGTVCCRQNV